MEWFESQGAGIYFPIGHSPHSDFIAEFGERLVRVQVKTCIVGSEQPLERERSALAAATRAGAG